MRALSALAFALALSPCTACLADTIGAWDHGTRDKLFYAVTINERGNVFGQFCMATEETCLYLVGLPTRCEVDAAYPVLVNADSGAFNAILVCRGPVEGRALYRYVFSTFGPVDEAVRESGKIGFAMPVEGDQFWSVSFSLEGATASLSNMRAAARKAERPASPKGTGGQVL